MNLNLHQGKSSQIGKVGKIRGLQSNTLFHDLREGPTRKSILRERPPGARREAWSPPWGPSNDPHPGSSQLKALGRDNAISVPSSVSLSKALLGRLYLFWFQKC